MKTSHFLSIKPNKAVLWKKICELLHLQSWLKLFDPRLEVLYMSQFMKLRCLARREVIFRRVFPFTLSAEVSWEPRWGGGAGVELSPWSPPPTGVDFSPVHPAAAGVEFSPWPPAAGVGFSGRAGLSFFSSSLLLWLGPSHREQVG